MAGASGNTNPVQVASIQTIWQRCVQKNSRALPDCDLLVIDECHRSLSRTYRELIDIFGGVTLGLTATPCRGDGTGLGHIYEDMVQVSTVAELTEQGHLVPARYYAPSVPDLEGVKVRMGDYIESDLEGRMDRAILIGDLVENWARIAKDRQTVVFTTGVRHSIHIMERFIEAGVMAEHIDGKTPKYKRDQILKDFTEGKIQLISNCMVLTEGWDCPSCDCLVLARPTKSIGLYLQMAGRTLRPHPGKEDCLIIDHSGAVYEHGFVDDPIVWDLNESGKVQDKISQSRKKKPITCPSCNAVYSGQGFCPECGHVPETQPKVLDTHEGDLVEVTAVGYESHEYTYGDKMWWFAGLEYYRIEKGYKPGWAKHAFNEKFGHWPSRIIVACQPVPPGIEIKGFIRHKQIRYSKSRG
jgi:superfamily II DNA or RNA helicase